MIKSYLIPTLATLAAGSLGLQAQNSMVPLAGFGGTDGWLAPGEVAWMTSADSAQRGLAFGNGKLYLAYNGSGIKMVDILTAADLGNLTTTGISGGARAVNMVCVSKDGTIYGANLTTQSTSTPYKVYAWATDAAIPSTVYSGALLPAGRVGDTLAVLGTGPATRIAAGFGSTPVVAGNNGYGIVDPSTPNSGTTISFAGSPPAAGDFRLGITFGAGVDSVIGSQGASGFRVTSYSGATGTLLGTGTPTSTAERPMSYAMVNGLPVLATISTGDGRVRVYDMTNPLMPQLLLTSTALSGLASNGNGTGAIAWGQISGSSANLYALSTNQGIQAFTLTIIPEPTAVALLGLGVAALLLGRRSRR